MMTKEERSLMDALSAARVSELPPQNQKKEGSIWIRAIAKVRKSDGTANYALVENRGTGSPEVIRDFGNPAIIRKIEALHPYWFLDNNWLPDFEKDKSIIDYLKDRMPKEDVVQLLSATNPDGTEKSEEDYDNDRRKVLSSIFIKAIEFEDARYDGKTIIHITKKQRKNGQSEIEEAIG